MKNLKHIALFLSCLVIASCTKDIDEKEPSNECSILDIQLTGQLGKATIERVDDNQGTVTLYIFEQADYPWEAVGVEALALSAYATADVSDGDTLDFRNPERKARIIVRSQTGKQVLWTVYLKPYDPFYVGTWAVSDIKIYLDQNISGNGTGKWDTSMGGSEFGLFASPELDNIITITMNEEMVDGQDHQCRRSRRAIRVVQGCLSGRVHRGCSAGYGPAPATSDPCRRVRLDVGSLDQPDEDFEEQYYLDDDFQQGYFGQSFLRFRPAGCVGRYAGQQFLQQLLAQFVQVLVYRTGRRIGRTWLTLTTGPADSKSGC